MYRKPRLCGIIMEDPAFGIRNGWVVATMVTVKPLLMISRYGKFHTSENR